MKTTPLFLSLLCFLTASVATFAAVDRPNVIVILTDDQGYADLGAHGHPILKTPNLDELHDQSVRFADFHVAPVCTPTRGELMSGLYALRNKAGMVPAGRNLMRRDIETMPKIFATNGYATGLFGKWHLGDTWPHRPMDRGFQRVIWHQGWGLASEIEYDNSYYATRYLDEMEVRFSDKFCTDLWFGKAMEWMDSQIDKGQPFFSYIALNTPHGPFDPKPADRAKYKGKAKGRIPDFYGLIDNIDQNYGRLEQWLDRRGIRENTILLFMNDNGSAIGAPVFNAGMRGKKGDAYEGGHRAMCFFRWPAGKFGSPRTVQGNAHVTDILPTFVDLLDLKTSSSFDGTSLKAVLRDQDAELKGRKIIVQYGGRHRPARHLKSCVMMDEWRLVSGKELYNIKDDIGQANNVADQHPQIVEALEERYSDYWNSIKDSVEVVEPLVVGHGQEPYTELTCVSWIEVDCDNRTRVANAGGRTVVSGAWQIEVATDGTYIVQLSRWPFHMNRKLNLPGPDKTIAGDSLKPGRALPIESGGLSIDGVEVVTNKPNAEATMVEMTIELKQGLHKMEGWFEDARGRKLSGAFYGRVRKQ